MQRNPGVLKDTTPLLARSLGIRVDEKCLDRLPQLQAPCLMQGQETLILNDGHSVSIVEALTNGPASDLVMAASCNTAGGVRLLQPVSRLAAAILAGCSIRFGVANYQYIPALATAVGKQLTLDDSTRRRRFKIRNRCSLRRCRRSSRRCLHRCTPSARKTSTARAEIRWCCRSKARRWCFRPSMRTTRSCASPARTAKRSICRRRRMRRRAASSSIPRRLQTASLEDRFEGSLHGYWGFEKFDGPGFQLVNTQSQAWAPSSTDDESLIVGRANTIHLQAGSVACIDRIMVKDPAGKELRVEWSPVKANEVQINLPLQQAQPGPLTAARFPVRRERTASARAARLSRGRTLRRDSRFMRVNRTAFSKAAGSAMLQRLSLQGTRIRAGRSGDSAAESDALRMEVKPAATSDVRSAEAASNADG